MSDYDDYGDLANLIDAASIEIDESDISPDPSVPVPVVPAVPSQEKPDPGTAKFFEDAMKVCGKKYGNPKGSEILTKRLQDFCQLLNANKVKDSREAFEKLPVIYQCIFLYIANNILSNKDKYPIQSYQTAFYVMKLFRGKTFREGIEPYKKYLNDSVLKANYELARLKFSKAKPLTSVSKTPGEKKERPSKYDKRFQRRATPDEADPLYIFYTTLYKEKPQSRLAITWLTEQGVFGAGKRTELEAKYEKLWKENKLIR